MVSATRRRPTATPPFAAARGWAWLLLPALAALAACQPGSKPGPGGAGAKSATGGAAGAPPPLPAEVTFSEHVAPVLFANCTACHRPGESAPFSLLSYADAAERASQIAEVTASRYMPPWLPEHGFGDFEGERRLTGREIALIGRWAESGAPEGDPARTPPVPLYTEGWQLGEPDLVVTFPEPFTVPAEGLDVYRNLVAPILLEDPRYVRAMELRPGNNKLVHHAFILVDTSRQSRRLDEADPGPGYGGMDSGEGAQSPPGHFISWQPGKVATEAPEGMSWRLVPGADLVLQLHLQPSGREEAIQPTVGLFFTDQPPSKTPFKIVLRSVDIDIPPGERDYTIEKTYRTPVDLQVLGVIPHAHYLGQQLHGFAVLPNGEKRWLIKIDDWDFNWQGDYRFKTPVRVPRGSVITQRFTYDNSAGNPRNPHDPPVRVRFGINTTDEMGELWMQVLTDSRGDLERLQRDYGRGVFFETVKRMERALALDPNDAGALVKLAKVRLAQNKLSEAGDLLGRALAADPGNATAHYLSGLVLVRGGNLPLARKAFEAAVAADPADYRAHNSLGMVHLQAGRFAAAEKHFRDGVEANAASAVLLSNLGYVILRQERPADALPLLERSLQLRPGDAETLRHLEAAQRMLAQP